MIRLVIASLVAVLLFRPVFAAEEDEAPELPAPVTTEHVLSTPGGDLAYTATAGFLPVESDKDMPGADIFYVAYTLDGAEAADRPLSFVFNGGPGAASVYLHLGALGPMRLVTTAEGLPAPPPARLAPNPESWLAFTDLVFVDPVGTGYSRSRAAEDDEDSHGSDRGGDRAYWGVENDLDSLAAFIRLYLTRTDRWASPKVIVGESYGGFRVARLAGSLPSDHHIPLNGAILVSPAMEFALLNRTRFTLLPWVLTFPSMAASAEVQGRGVLGGPDTIDLGPDALAEAERFARGPMLAGLARGDGLAGDARAGLDLQIARYLGMPAEEVARTGGRVSPEMFAKLLLRDEGRLVGRYDGSISGIDPYPDRLDYSGGDPSFDYLVAAFADAITPYIRDELGFETDRVYEALSTDVNRGWDWSDGLGNPFRSLGSTESLAFGMATNPDLQVVIVHGLFDLITPYSASRYLVDTMGLAPEIRANLRLYDYPGGHMFYTHNESLARFTADLRGVYERMSGPAE